MKDIRIGIVGGGYMGKAHAVAYAAVASIFDTKLRPILEMVCSSSGVTAEKYRKAFGFSRATSDWRVLVADPKVDAIIIATPQKFHRVIAEMAFKLGKPVFCEKPLAENYKDAKEMCDALKNKNLINMVNLVIEIPQVIRS